MEQGEGPLATQPTQVLANPTESSVVGKWSAVGASPAQPAARTAWHAHGRRLEARADQGHSRRGRCSLYFSQLTGTPLS